MSIKYISNTKQNHKDYQSTLVTKVIMDEVKAHHESYDHYNQTKLVALDALADNLMLDKIYVKDESARFRLNSFKVLGAAYAIGKSLAEKLDEDIKNLPFEVLKERVKKELTGIELAATTDGNHGRGVAWIGKKLGLKVHIYMPKGTTENRLQHILDQDAIGTVTEMNYDETVRWLALKAQEENWLIIQDTAWEGYLDVPIWIMQGYSTIARETIDELKEIPTHIFIQAGVGAFAGIMAEAFYNAYKEKCPKIVIVEAEAANCFYQGAVEGKKVIKTGELNTIMAGLACGEPNPIGYNILMQLAEGFISAPDWAAANGMRILGNPLSGDDLITSGESGAVGIGALESIMTHEEYKYIREGLGLNASSRVLTFSTEGDTDHEVYRDVVWYGNHAR
jgi:diaminopropionate ammonia-lyase